jgi:hypothetical protein
VLDCTSSTVKNGSRSVSCALLKPARSRQRCIPVGSRSIRRVLQPFNLSRRAPTLVTMRWTSISPQWPLGKFLAAASSSFGTYVTVSVSVKLSSSQCGAPSRYSPTRSEPIDSFAVDRRTNRSPLGRELLIKTDPQWPVADGAPDYLATAMVCA